MEHRQSIRTRGRLALLVYKRGLPVATGQVHDASRKGLFIATDYEDVDLNQSLEVEFQLSGQHPCQFRRLKGHVVRKSDRGLGLELEGLEINNPAVLSALMTSLNGERSLINAND